MLHNLQNQFVKKKIANNIRTATGEYELELYQYENNPTTPGNPVETRTDYDPLDIRPESTRITAYNSDGTIAGVVNDYDAADFWRTNHSLNDAHLRSFDEAAVAALSQEIERSAFHGGATPESTPWVLSYEPQFGAGYDFSAGSFDVDTGGAYGSIAEDEVIATVNVFRMSSRLPVRTNQGYCAAAAMV